MTSREEMKVAWKLGTEGAVETDIKAPFAEELEHDEGANMYESGLGGISLGDVHEVEQR